MLLPRRRGEYLGGVVFFGDEGGELDAEALHVLPPLPLDLLPLHPRRRCAAAAAAVTRAASPPFRCRIAAAATPLNIHLLTLMEGQCLCGN